jgi:hypothetical protein
VCELLLRPWPICFFEIVNHTFYFSFLRDIKINIKTYKFVVSVQNVIKPLYVSNFVRSVGEDKLRRERASVMWAEGRIIQAKRNMIKKLVETENGLFSYIYNNVLYIKSIKVERKDPTSRRKLSWSFV